MVVEICEYLSRPNPDFETGFGLFCKYSVNQSMMSWIGRKHDMERLIYELNKLSALDIRRTNPAAATHVALYHKSAAPAAPKPAVPEPVRPQIVFKTYDERKTRRADLPSDLQKVYDGIVDEYALRRRFHEKMKAASTDADRAQLRERLLICQRHVEEGWKKIDAYLLQAEKAQAEDPEKFNEATFRAYVSKMLKKEKITPVQVETVKGRVKALMDHQCVMTDATIEALKERGWM